MGTIEHNPRPITYFWSALFIAPTGALTLISMEFLGAIFNKSAQKIEALGYTSPNSAHPCKKGKPTPSSLYAVEEGDCPMIIIETLLSPNFLRTHCPLSLISVQIVESLLHYLDFLL